MTARDKKESLFAREKETTCVGQMARLCKCANAHGSQQDCFHRGLACCVRLVEQSGNGGGSCKEDTPERKSGRSDSWYALQNVYKMNLSLLIPECRSSPSPSGVRRRWPRLPSRNNRWNKRCTAIQENVGSNGRRTHWPKRFDRVGDVRMPLPHSRGSFEWMSFEFYIFERRRLRSNAEMEECVRRHRPLSGLAAVKRGGGERT